MAQQSDSQIRRVIQTRRFLDRRHNPPEFVDEEVPTVSRNLLVLRRGRVRSPRGTILGSVRLTGSIRPLSAPGTFSLRVTRVSVFTGSRNMAWFIRHSRDGTYDVIHFPSPGQETRLSGPMEPIYAFGPGTVVFGWLGDAAGAIGSAYDLGQFLEGYVG